MSRVAGYVPWLGGTVGWSLRLPGSPLRLPRYVEPEAILNSWQGCCLGSLLGVGVGAV